MNISKILVVEDESIVALDIQARLVRLGYQVVGIADSGEEAIRIAEARHPDLALMDIRLKGDMDGVEAAQQLRAHFDIPVVYLTAYADEATLQRAKLTEPFGYLVKPFQERELHSTVEMALYKIGTEKQSKAQAVRLQKIISSSPDGIALLGSDGRLLLANAKAEDYLSVLAGVDVGDPIQKLGDHPIEQLSSHINGEVWHEIELTGSPQRVFEVNVSSMQSNSGTSSTVSLEQVIVIREVTAEREIQNRIQLQDRLAAVGQFSAGIAHDFNNILASIILQPYIIQKIEPNLSPKAQDRLDTIAQQAKRASSLIQQILDFSRASRMEKHSFDLIPLFKELTKMLERLLPDSIRLEFNYQHDDFTMNGDATRILQMLMNLSVNARDAMPNGGVLHIQLARVRRQDVNLDSDLNNREWIGITVSDTGTGIDPDILPHIFEPFFTTKGPGQGTGLGLAQVYGIVQQHEGHITVDSPPGRGTTFFIHFPALCHQPSVEVHSDSPETSPIQGNRQTVLLVEDHLAVRQSICEILELSNFQVLTASNGREALAKLEQSVNPVDLILSDLVMPEMGGVELCRKLRQQGSNVKILTMTAYASDESLGELQSLGIIDCLNKPVNVHHLLKAVEMALLVS